MVGERLLGEFAQGALIPTNLDEFSVCVAETFGPHRKPIYVAQLPQMTSILPGILSCCFHFSIDSRK